MPLFRFPEGSQTFTFDVVHALRWDRDTRYTGGIGRLAGTKAVDFVLRLEDDAIVLFEVTDFRSHRIETRAQLRTPLLVSEFTQKVGDSLAGLTWAAVREAPANEVSAVTLRTSRKDTKKLLVVLWLEQDHDDVAVADALRAEVERRLRGFLAAKVIVTSSGLERQSSRPLEWVTVT